MTTVSVQAYFRNQMPAGRYPYPFWHSDAKWKAYETSNELRFRMDARGKVLFAYRADTWPEDTRPAGYEPARHPRSEERRVGKECVSTCRSRWAPDPQKKTTSNNSKTND